MIGDVWCSKCDQPTVEEVELTTGERKAYCAKHLADLRWFGAFSRRPEPKGAKR